MIFLNNSHKSEYRTSELEHSNAVLLIQNTLLGEKFFSLAQNLEKLADWRLIQAKSDEKVVQVFAFLKKISDDVETLEKGLKNTLKEKENLLEDSDLAKHLKVFFSSNKKSLIKPYKNRIKELQDEIARLKAKDLELSEKVSFLETKSANFILELEKQRRKSRLSLFFADKTEKICGKCQKVYSPLMNFNWSCRFHKARIVNNLWFCCGKTGEDAGGCIIDKHFSVEELDSIENELKDSKLFCVVSARQNCKASDHLTSECFFDPNVRTRFEPYEELKRLEKNQEKRIMKKSKVKKFDENVFERYKNIDF